MGLVPSTLPPSPVLSRQENARNLCFWDKSPSGTRSSLTPPEGTGSLPTQPLPGVGFSTHKDGFPSAHCSPRGPRRSLVLYLDLGRLLGNMVQPGLLSFWVHLRSEDRPQTCWSFVRIILLGEFFLLLLFFVCFLKKNSQPRGKRNLFI